MFSPLRALSTFLSSNKILLQDIPRELFMGDIKNNNIQELYSKFIFQNLNFKDTQSGDTIVAFLIDLLKNFRFLTYEITQLQTEKEYPIGNLVICYEEKCVTIESLNLNLISGIFNGIKCISIDSSANSDDQFLKEEIKSFINYFKKDIISNKFVKRTIRPLIAYIIKRYYLPSHFFKDNSFFSYDNYEFKFESLIKTELTGLFQIDNEKELKKSFSNFSKFLEEKIKDHHLEKSYKSPKYDFNKSDFIILRHIYAYTKIYLVIHIPSFQIFSMKLFDISSDQKMVNHEKEFCNNHSHPYFTRFYGFVKENNEIIGCIYQFMSNDNLEKFIEKNKETINDFYSLTIVNRIIKGIEYLQSNSLVHRDLKPANILIDHDFIGYISDFETIRTITKDNSFSFNFGTPQYESPEQYKGEKISFPTDIYSFGLIIYFIFEKKHMFVGKDIDRISDILLNENEIPEFKSCIKEIQNLSRLCIKLNPDERPSLEKIKEILFEVNSFSFLEQKLNDKNILKIDKSVLINYFLSNILLFSENSIQLQNYLKIISLFLQIMLKKDYSSVLCSLGVAYYEGNFVEKNILKSRKYFELSAEQQNSEAEYYLSRLYLIGEGVEKNVEKGLDYLKSSMRKNNPKALFRIGSFYYYGKYYKQNYSLAKKCFELAAEQNDPDSLLFLGIIYSDGQGVRQDFSKAKKYYELAAKYGNPKGYFLIGTLYSAGQGVRQDYSKAMEYYKIGASLDESNSLINIGYLYDEGFGVPQDHKKAMEYYLLSSKLDNSNADFCIGLHYLKGEGVEKDIEKAKKYFEKSAEKNNSKAQYALGQFYSEGQFIAADFVLAKKYFELALINGNKDAYNNLGMLYFDGNGVEQNYLKAKEYFELAAKQNDPNSLFNLGIIYFQGLGVEIDYQKAHYYLKLAANLNNTDALVNLGILYDLGCGVQQNYSIALQCYKNAAKQNNSNALIQLGSLYYEGRGVKQDCLKANEYFKRAAQLLNYDSYYFLGFQYYEGKGVKQDFVKARECYEIAAEHNNSIATTNLGQLYLLGKGVERDYNKAKQYFEKTADSDQNALLNLAYMYYYGLGVAVDFLRVKFYFEQCAKHNNSIAFFGLGILYLLGNGVQQDFSKAREYFELSAKFKNPSANNILGVMYMYGEGVDIDYSKAKYYFEQASFEKCSDSLYYLGLFYFNQGELHSKNYLKAREYFELAGKQNNPSSLFYLGYIYENGKGVDKDLRKAIQYYSECSSKHSFLDRNTIIENINKRSISEINKNNFNYYRSNNDLGLIYITEKEFQNIELAEKYLKEAGLNEYPFGQNNFGLLCQYYLKNNSNALHMFNRSSEHHFALAEFNLGHFYEEEENNIVEAIKHFKLASEYENVIYRFRNQTIIDDERLNISKIFIICFTNLKLIQYHYLHKERSDLNAKNYLMKAIFQPLFRFLSQHSYKSYIFQFKYEFQNGKIIISNFKDLFLTFPLFNKLLNNNNSTGWKMIEKDQNEKEIMIILQNSNQNIEYLGTENNHNENVNNIYFDEYKKIHSNDFSLVKKPKINFHEDVKNVFQNMNIQNYELESKFDQEKYTNFIRFKTKSDNFTRFLIFPNNLYENIYDNIDEYIDDIEFIVNEMSKVIYTPPYDILFGRIHIHQENIQSNDLNQSFYEGFLSENDNSCQIC